MAKQIARLLRSELTVSDELSKIAKLLQSKGRGKDTILAHITPKEAQLLKDRGGAGTRNPETGLLEFYDEDIDISGGLDRPVEAAPVAEAAPAPVEVSGEGLDTTSQAAYAMPQAIVPRPEISAADVVVPKPISTVPPSRAVSYGAGAAPTEEFAAGVPAVKAPAPEKSFFDKLSTEQLMRMGLGLGGAGLGALRARQGAKQIQAATEEQKALGAPYQAQGRELIRAAQAGELTPTSQQAYQAVQAQLAQSTATRGGVGAAQASAQLEAFRQQLLDNQYKFGLNVAQVGDSIALGAIKSGLQLDRQLQQATSNYYTSLASMAGGLPIYQVAQTPPVA